MAQNAEDRSCITQFELGEMFEKDDRARDYPSAFKWYLRSAKHGYRKAQHRLGTMYARGAGVTKNYIEAYAWCKVSAAQHSQRAILKLKKIEAYMSAEQISSARKLSRQYYEMYVAPSANRVLFRKLV
jgi:TPR repeat protein